MKKEKLTRREFVADSAALALGAHGLLSGKALASSPSADPQSPNRRLVDAQIEFQIAGIIALRARP